MSFITNHNSLLFFYIILLQIILPITQIKADESNQIESVKIDNYKIQQLSRVHSLDLWDHDQQETSKEDLSYEKLSLQRSFEYKKCDFVDLRQSGRLTTENRNQGNIAWCYAHTASDLIQYHFNTLPISASDLAINYNNRAIPQTIKFFRNFVALFSNHRDWYLENDTGFIKIAIQAALEHGVCPRENMPDESLTRVDWSTGVTQSMGYKTGMYDLLKNLKEELKFKTLEEIGYFYSFPKISSTELVRILLANKRSDVFDQIAEHSCNHHRIFFPPVKITQVIRNKNIFQSIDQQLDRHNIVAMDYFSGVLHDKDNFKSHRGSLHTSSLIGRRWNNENHQCEYLVRNSYGSSCEGYDPDYQCEQGNIWIPQNNLQQSLLMVSFIQ